MQGEGNIHQCSGPDCQFTANQTKEHLLYHVLNDIPTKISHRQTNLLPSRADFLDSKLRQAFAAQVKANKPILFFPSTVDEKNDFVDRDLKTKFYIIGVLPCGSKTLVILDGIEIYIDVAVPGDDTPKNRGQFDDFLRGMLMSKKLKFLGISEVKMFRLHGFQKTKRTYKRIHFNNLQERKEVLKQIAAVNKELAAATTPSGYKKLETASDDVKLSGKSDYYFPKVARESKFATADWNRIEKYETLEALPNGLVQMRGGRESRVTTNCDYAFKVNIRDYVKLSKDKRNELLKPSSAVAKVIDKDSTIVMQWDIETYSTNQSGLVPTPDSTDFTIFMMNSAYFWQHSEEQLFSICCVDVDTNARSMVMKKDPKTGMISPSNEKTLVTVICETERNVLTTHMEIVGRMAPEITAAFNGSSFDWPLYREKLRREHLLIQLASKYSSLPPITSGKWAITEESVLKWNFTKEKVKIDAENSHILDCVANFPGMLDTDVLPVFMKLYTRMEVRKAGSLNFFLAKNGLEAKEDMLYKRMFRIYERALKLKDIKACHCSELGKNSTQNHSCPCCNEIVKEIDCKAIVVKEKASGNGTFNDEIEYSDELHDDLVTNLEGLITPKCCFCGKKPRNLRDMADVNLYCTVDCLRPQQLYVKRSIIADKRELSNMSCVSLYDSFYRADGMKVRNLIGKYAHKQGIAFSNAHSDKSENDKDHYPGAWVFPPVRGLNNKRPITGLDFASLYPSLMMAYNLSPDMVVYILEEALALQDEGYSIHHIAPFDFERGANKGNVGNAHLVKEGWTVRHNGVFNNKKDSKIVTKYTKVEKITIVSKDTSVKPTVLKYPSYNIDPVTGARAKADPPPDIATVIDEAKLAGKKVTRAFGYDPVHGRDPLPGERMGIFPFIVKKLFDKRVPIKGEFVRLSKLKEEMESAKVKEWPIKLSDGSMGIITMKEVNFQINKIDSKQKALKVLANTFYGESGNYRSSIYELLVAAGITCAGQMNIKKVAEFVISKGFSVQYGDTDSLYLVCPDSVYIECDAKYAAAIAAIEAKYNGIPNIPLPDKLDETKMGLLILEYKKARTDARIAYWDEMVSISMITMNKLKEEVSDYLLSDNGTCFLNMAYEEVGFPTVLTGKKKYYLTPHIEKINFYPKEIFIRGIDIIKQGQAKIAKQLGDEFMRESLSPENERELIDIAEDKIRKIYSLYSGTDLDPTPFILNGRYKPNKKNVPVLSFVARMRDEQKKYLPNGVSPNSVLSALYEPPEAGDKFEFVVVQKDQRYTLQGSKIELKKGDRMEYVRVFRASQSSPNPMQIDLSFYVKNAIIGLFARFIAYHPKFQPPADMYDINDKEQYKQMDQYCVDTAGKYLEQLCDSITGFDKTAMTQQGRDFRKIYTSANKVVRYDFMKRHGPTVYLIDTLDIHGGDSEDESRSKLSQSSRMIQQMKIIAEENAREVATLYGKNFLKLNEERKTSTLFQLRRWYNGMREMNISKQRVRICDEREKSITDKLYAEIPKVARIIYLYERNFIRLIDDMRKVKTEDAIDLSEQDLDSINKLSEEDREALNKVYKLLMQLMAVMQVRQNTLSIVSAIELEKARIIDDPVVDINIRAEAKNDAKNATVLEEYQFN